MTANFETLWQEVEAIPHPGPAPTPEASSPHPSDHARFYRRLLDARQVALALCWTAFVSMPVLSIAGGASVPLWILGVIGAVGLLALCCVRAIPSDFPIFKNRLHAAEVEWQSVEDEWEQCAGPRPFEVKRLQLLDLLNEWNSLAPLEEQKMEGLQDAQWEAQLLQFLSGFPVQGADIFNVGDGRLKNLHDAKVKTAADIKSEESLSRIQGIGHAIAKSLIDWRRKLESEFEFDPTQPLLPAHVDKVKGEIAAQAKDLEIQLRSGITDLRKALARIQKVRIQGFDTLNQEFGRYQKARLEASLLS